MRISNLAEAETYLANFYKYSDAEYKLSNMQKLMDFLGNPERNLRVIHVAGTSGKTSTAYYVTSLLLEAGAKTGMTISPHIENLAERVQLNGKPLSETEFCNKLSEFIILLEASELKPSWFELLIAFAYWYFSKEKVDYAVVEVGLGGLLDATNVALNSDKVCVITDIGLDHINILGNTLEEIAYQKAGIIHELNQVFMFAQSDEIMNQVIKRARNRNAKLNIITEEPKVEGAMPEYQYRNWFIAKRAYDYIQKRDDLDLLSEEQLNKTRHTYIPGRMDIRHVKGKTLVLDGAHNFQKMNAFIASFRKLYPEAKPVLLIGLKEGKDIKAILPLIAGLASRIITTNFALAQDTRIMSSQADTLTKYLLDLGFNNVVTQPDQKLAIENMLEGDESICIITGSLYLIGDLQSKKLI